MQALAAAHALEKAVGHRVQSQLAWLEETVCRQRLSRRSQPAARAHVQQKNQSTDVHPSCEASPGTALSPWQALFTTWKLLTNSQSLQIVSGQNFWMEKEHISSEIWAVSKAKKIQFPSQTPSDSQPSDSQIKPQASTSLQTL